MAGAASAIFLLDMKGRVLIWRDYRGDVSAPQAERAFAKLMDGEVCVFSTALMDVVLVVLLRICVATSISIGYTT